MADDIGSRLRAMEKAGIADLAFKHNKPTQQWCITCGRVTPILEVFTGEARQRMCEDCRRKYHDLAKIMCRTCGKFLGFMHAGITPTGYHVKRDETLHTPWCNNCNRERAKREGTAPIEELDKFLTLKRQNELAGAVSSGKGVVNG